MSAKRIANNNVPKRACAIILNVRVVICTQAGSSGRAEIIDMNSARNVGWSRKQPVMRVVIVTTPGFLIPRVVMH